MYRITIARTAEKELARIGDIWAERITRSIDKLAENPRPHGCKKLKGSRYLWRIRIGDYRVIYAIDDDIRVIGIERVAHRKEAYD